MEDTTILYSSLSLFLLILIFNFFFQTKTHHKKRPPGPLSLPIIGNLHLIKPPLHRTFHNLSKKYGPIISLRFGSRLVVVVSSFAATEECFNAKNDVVFANRPRTLAGRYIGYNYSTIVGAPYGDHWKNLRRISALDIFSSIRLNVFESIRKDEVRRLLKKLSRNSLQNFVKVEMRPLLSELTFNNIMRMVSGKHFSGDKDANEDQDAKNSRELMAEIMEFSQASNPVDFLPILKWIGFGGFEKKLMNLGKRTDDFLQNLIEEHQQKKKSLNNADTMVDHLLCLQESQPESYTDQIIKGLMLILLVAGTDTSAITLEWAMAEMLNNPEVLRKARAELDSKIGQERLIEEQDLPKLHYLQSILSETIRLYPASPLLVPHTASDDCQVGGYDVPRDTILFVNAWAIHRDPTVWDDPTRFNPDRFENGQDRSLHKILTFGLGRRSCPGAILAQRIMGLTLGSLIQCFDWERVCETEVDMSERDGLTMPIAQPLEAMCKARPIMLYLLFQNYF